MQNAKDSFYEVLRTRLNSVNPERTIVVRGITRPGLVVDENEALSVSPMLDCFHLRWTDLKVSEQLLLPLVTQTCEISYATAGSAWNGGLDRGRVLAAMDADLLAVLGSEPRNATKTDFSALAAGGAPSDMDTRIWWSDVSFEPVESKGECVKRVAMVQVMSYQEAGER